MASNKNELFGAIPVVVMIMVMLSDIAMATTGCKSAIVSLSPCITYVGGNSSSPSHSCCMQLADVVKTQPWCLCALVGGHHASTGLKINQTLALGLPDACNVHTPPVSGCAGNKTETAPTPKPTSDGSTLKLPFYFTFVLLMIASTLYG